MRVGVPTERERQPMGDDGAPTAWLARTGEGGFALADCIAAGVVALRYQTVPDASSSSVAEIAAALRDDPDVSSYTAVAKMLARFVHEVAIGDLIVTPHLGTRMVYLGEVTGPYEHREPTPVPTFRHLRTVDWFGSLSRDTDLTADRRRHVDRQPT